MHLSFCSKLLMYASTHTTPCSICRHVALCLSPQNQVVTPHKPLLVMDHVRRLISHQGGTFAIPLHKQLPQPI
ncbi:hypothetical protein Lalb_Chr21g0314201 [Lupinus albus]|uniref:Uncharacterized protein n=1 Tax=Lupinus albus TaxID=3870 RepID=A0A6A4NGK9_LUPAL|nr:hypothetical protein Lalb_Chr21g0314201 [Lupinus albus]